MIPINPLVAEPGVHRADFIGRGIYMAGAFGMLGVLLVFFVSALLAGGRFGPTSDVKWDARVPWPAVPVPGWFVIALCFLPVVGAVILVLKATWAQAPELVSLLGMTVIMFILLPVAWAGCIRRPAGPVSATGIRNSAWASIGSAPCRNS